MPITPYALNVKAVDVTQPLNTFAAIRQMQAQNQQQQMNALAMQKAQREMEESDAFKNALTKYDVNTPEGQKALISAGGIKGLETVSSLRQLAAQEQQAKTKLFEQNMELLKKGASMIPDTLEDYTNLYKAAIGDHPELKSFLPDPKQYVKGQTIPSIAYSTDELLRSRKPFAVGGEAVFNPVTGQFSYPEKPSKEPTDWQKLVDKEGNVRFVSPSTGQERSFGNIGVAPQKGAAGKVTPEAKEAAQENISNVLDEVDNALEGLKGLGEIRQTGGGILSNIKASAASSETGQAIGKVLGTPGQAYRDRIKTIKPLFTTQLAQATGLNSKQLDSNKELQLFLDTINDPSVDYYVAKSQLQLLKQMFASGAVEKSDEGLTNAMKVVNSIAKKGVAPTEQVPSRQETPKPANEGGWGIEEVKE